MLRQVRLAVVSVLFALLALPPAASAAPFLYATRPAGGVVTVIDLADGTIAGSLPAGSLPAGAAVDAAGSRLVVADASGGGALSYLLAGGSTGLATGAAPAGVAITPDGATIAVVSTQTDSVALFAAAGGAPLATLPVGDAPLAVAADATHLVVTNYGDDTVSVIDLGTHATSTVAVGGFPSGVALAGGRAWVADFGDDAVSVVDLATATLLTTVGVGTAPRGVTAGGGRAFVGNLDDGTVSVLDVATATVVATWALPTSYPTDVLLSPAGDRLYAAHPGAQLLSVLDTTSGAALPSLTVPAGLTVLAGVAGVSPGFVAAVPSLSGIGLLALVVALGALGLRRLRGPMVVTLLATITAAAGAARAQTVVFSDDTFAAADWTIHSASVGGGSQLAMQSLTVGNPAPSRLMDHDSPGTGGGPAEVVEVVHRYTGGTYDPASAGAISAIDASWQRIVTLNDGGTGLVEESFVVIQGGTAFATASEVFSTTSWQAVSHTGLVALDFDDGGGGHPDFSAGGAPIAFGYRRRTTSDAPIEAFVQHGIDAFAVTVHSSGGSSGPGTLAFAARTFAVVAGPATIPVVREGGTDGAATVDVVLSIPLYPPDTVTASWGAGEGGTRTVTFDVPADLAPVAVDGIARFNLELVNVQPPSGGPALAPLRNRAVLLYSSDPALTATLQLLGILLSRLAPALLLVLAPLALALAWRRRRSTLAPTRRAMEETP